MHIQEGKHIQEVTQLKIEQEGTSAKMPTRPSKTEAGLSQEEAGSLVTRAGGIFLGGKLLRTLNSISLDTVVPPLPEKLSEEFLKKDHPLSEGPIAQNIILGFDPHTSAWYCFDKSVVPGSVSSEGLEGGLTLPQQLELLKREGDSITVCGVEYESPTNYQPILNLLEVNRQLHEISGRNLKDLPLYRTWGRTADPRDPSGLCIAVGFHSRRGYIRDLHGSKTVGGPTTGLLAEWKIQ